ncbi:MAG TPA: sialidase family protein [Thermomonospora sp.]|nr:sialidase family protein [Thermomonospora sp.]
MAISVCAAVGTRADATEGCPGSTVFRAGGHGYRTFRIPAVVAVPAARGGRPVLVAFAEARVAGPDDHGDIDVVARRSSDGGCSWGPLRVVHHWGRNTVGNPTPVVDPRTGHVVLLTVRQAGHVTEQQIMRGQVAASAGRRVFVQRSTDRGLRWTAPREITPAVKGARWRWYATGPGHALALTSGPYRGRLVVPANHSVAPPKGSADSGAEPRYYRGHALLSDDGGRRWRIGYVDTVTDDAVNVSETTAVQLPDGRVYVNARNQGGTAGGNRAHAHSRDGGRTLTGPFRVTRGLVTPVVQGSLLRVRVDRANVLVFSAPADARERRRMALRTSRDGGRTWRHSLTVSARPAAYSDLVQVSATVLGLLFETGTQGPYESVEFRRIGLRRVAAGGA